MNVDYEKLTPTEAAKHIASCGILLFLSNQIDDPEFIDMPPAKQRAILKALCKLHNQLAAGPEVDHLHLKSAMKRHGL